MHFWISKVMYFKYCIGPNQRSLNLHSNFHFQVLQLRVLLVVEEVYLLHILSFLKGLHLNCYPHIDYFSKTVVLLLLVIYTSVHIVKMAVLIPKVPLRYGYISLFSHELIMRLVNLLCHFL